MDSVIRRSVYRFLIGLVLAAVLSVASCQQPPEQSPSYTVRFATGYPTAGGYYPLGQALARVYRETLPGVSVTVESTPGSSFNVNAVNSGDADIAFSLIDHAYRAYVRGTKLDPRPHTRLRGVAVVFESVVHLIVKSDSSVRRLIDLRRARIGYGRAPSDLPRPLSYSDILTASGALTVGDVHSIRTSFDELPRMLAGGEIDVWMVMSGYPFEAVSTLAREAGIRLLEIRSGAASRIRAKYPFYKPTVIPALTYAGQDEAVRTLAVDNVLLCREDLDPELVYRLTKAFFENLPRLSKDQEVAMQVNPDVAPATPIPLHPGAARYYRERELLR